MALNQVVLVWPGTASALMRKAGMKKPWITSRLRTSSFMGRFTGAKSTLVCLPFGYWNDQAHWRALTFTSMASAGALRMYS
ncbi:hypothetical protein GALL_504390 [mine drainage metagenome]|uniref:Uncharacterized protein n=1 Tax=mine drainage metagenome TaxID=410659 RepID=A0A1J5PJK7_9ZZZZ